MSVKIDPTEVRGRSAGSASGPRRPWRTIAFGGIGSLGLVAFTVGAFSFFGGLADPRARTPRPRPQAMNLPDLKDGIPALAPASDTAPLSPPPAPILNLPRPAVEQQRAATDVELALRTGQAASSEAARPAAADSTGSVFSRSTGSVSAKPTPAIENAQTLAADAKSVPLIAPVRTAGPLAPAKAETVKAKPSESRASASLPSGPDTVPAAVKPQAARAKAPEPKRVETKPATPKPAPIKTVRAVPEAKPIVEASAQPAPAPRAQPAEESEGFGTGLKNGWNAGVKAIGGMIGVE